MLRVHLENGVVSVTEAPVPDRPAGYALLRLLVAGICNTDLELQRGYYGFSGTPGHEFVAEVVEADDRALVGKRVVGEINLACAHCEWCRKGLGRHCPNRTVLGIVRHPGAFEEFFTLPERNLHVLPEGIPLERAVFTEPLAAACEILDQVTIPCGEPIAVLGDGKLGLLVAQVLPALAGALTGIPAGVALYAVVQGSGGYRDPAALWLLAIVLGVIAAACVLTALPARSAVGRPVAEILGQEA